MKTILVDGAHRYVHNMKAVGCTVTELIGPEATPEAFSNLASSVDLLRIACHGIGKPGEARHGLLLGDGEVVPPGLTDYVLSDAGQRFILDWEEIQGLTAPLVFSCACSSGSSSYVVGNERVSLDRTLLMSGTQSFLAPFWDVVARDAQEAIDEIIHSYLINPSQTLGETLRLYLDQHSLTHTSTALALFGDYL